MKNSQLGYLIILMMMLLSYTKVEAEVITVCSDCKVTSVKKGIALAQDYDTVLVKKGTYYEHDIFVDKPLTLKGEGYPIIDGQKKGEIIKITSDHVTIDGLFIINVGISYTTDFAAIRVIRSQHFTIQNVVLEKLFFGIYLEKSSNGKVYHNKIIGEAKDEYNSGNGIQLWYSHYVDVSNNHVQGTRDGIYLEFSDNIKITKNTSTKNLRYGLHFMFSDNDIYTQNTFQENGAGVAVMFSRNITMKNNVFKKNWGPSAYGMLLKEINDADIQNNIFEENTVGISIEGSNRITYKDNDFNKNGWAIRVIGACYTNSFTGNNFMNNSFDVSYNSKLNDNEIQIKLLE